MAWKRIGHLFSPSREKPWMVSHASQPVAEPIEGNRFRIYFSSRDDQNRSSIGTLEIDIRNPLRVQAISEGPLLSPGVRGLFDDSGLSMGCLVQNEGKKYLYYLGWNLGVTVPFRNSIGLALGQDDGTFERLSPAPIVDRNPVDPYGVSYPWVLRDKNQWHLWYGSNLEWGKEHGAMRHVIKHAVSSDGIHWERSGAIAVNLQGEEWGLSRPCVVRDTGGFKMWFSSRRDQYSIAYAESEDGVHWERRDTHGLSAEGTGWDSESVSYPFVFDHQGNRYLLYCGNGYGKTGFGIALWENRGAK